MTKQKQSFFERLTGARNIEESPSQIPIFEESSMEETVETYGGPQMTAPMTRAALPERPIWNDNNNINTMESEAVSDDAEGQLTIDVYQTEEAIVIKSTIAGVKPEDLDVAINNDMVTIKGERKNEEVVPDNNYYYQECYWGPFSRSILLPVDIIADKSEASLKNGILTIRLPKADTTRIKKIQVRGF